MILSERSAQYNYTKEWGHRLGGRQTHRPPWGVWAFMIRIASCAQSQEAVTLSVMSDRNASSGISSINDLGELIPAFYTDHHSHQPGNIARLIAHIEEQIKSTCSISLTNRSFP